MGVMFVTGASKGIGAATARRAARSGYDVAAGFHTDADGAASVVRSCSQAGARARAIRLDVSDEASVVAAFEEVDAELGPISCLVNNAGILFPQARLETFDAHRVERTMAVNVLGPIICAREAVLRMSTSRGGAGGSIVNVSSVAATLGSPDEYIDYAASKGAVDSMTVGLAREVAAEGIRVNAVRPGLIETSIHATGGDPGRVDRLASTLPMGRGGTAEEVAAVILFLASDAAGYMTGSIVDVAGGR